MERKVDWTIKRNDWVVVAADSGESDALDMAALRFQRCGGSCFATAAERKGAYLQVVEAEVALTRLVAHSALRDLVGAEEAARWVRELEEVEEEYPFVEYAAKLVRGEERVEKPWAAIDWLTMEGFGWRTPEVEDH